MTAAQKALDALAVPPDQRWTPATWTSLYAEAHRAEGPIRATGNAARDDAERMCRAVNLAAPLAAVVRAAMAGYASGGFDRALDRNDEGDQWAHQLVAALDAFAVAAQEMFP